MLTRGYEGTASIDDLLDFAERSVFGIAQGKLERSFSPISQVIKESLDVVDKLSKRKEHVTGVPTGYYDLDDITAGLQPSDLVVVAGRPSMGKTSLALGFATHAAIHANTVVGIFSLEMSKPQIVLRMLSFGSTGRFTCVENGKASKRRLVAIGRGRRTTWSKPRSILTTRAASPSNRCEARPAGSKPRKGLIS